MLKFQNQLVTEFWVQLALGMRFHLFALTGQSRKVVEEAGGPRAESQNGPAARELSFRELVQLVVKDSASV